MAFYIIVLLISHITVLVTLDQIFTDLLSIRNLSHYPIDDVCSGLTDEQRALRETVFNFCQKELAPLAQVRLQYYPQNMTPKLQGCESSFSNGTKFSSGSKKSVEMMELSSLSSVPLYKKFITIVTKFS